MARRAGFLVLSVALVAAVAVPLNAFTAKPKPVDVAVTSVALPEVKGFVAATHRRGKETLRLSVSLRGLEPTATYRLAGSTRTCSTRRRGPAVFRLDAKPTATPSTTAKAELFLPSLSVRANRPLRGTKSLHIVRLTPDGKAAGTVCRPFQGSSGDGQSI